MKLLNRAAICLFVLILPLLVLQKGSAQEGTAPFRLGVDARALAMGGAYVAVAGSYSDTYWNPAGLAALNIATLGYMAAEDFERGTGWSFVSGAGAIHLSFPRGSASLHSAGGLAFIRSVLPVIQTFGPGGEPTGTVDEEETLLIGSLSAGVRLGILDLYMGYNLKGYSHSLGEERGEGQGSDFGLLVDVAEVLSLGIAVGDIGSTRIKWPSGAIDEIKPGVRLGIAGQLLNRAILIAVQGNLHSGSTYVGIEVIPSRIIRILPPPMTLALRLGFQALPDDSLSTTLGVGIGLFSVNVDGALVLQPKRGTFGTISGHISF